MRINNSIKNISISLLSQLLLVLLGFISRKVFLDSLGIEYLGVNGLLTEVLSMLALVESGIGASIVYFLYKPLAEKNETKIIALIQLYKKAYMVIAAIILILCLVLYPFLGTVMKGSESISFIKLIYFLFVAKNIVYYLNAHKLALISADQKGYVTARVSLGFQVFTTIAKIVVLILTRNYILYLIIELAIFTIQNIFNGKIVEKRYSYIKTKKKYSIDVTEKNTLIKNVKALFLHNLGGYLVHGTDNILISSFIGIGTVGLYSNYTMIIGQLSSLLSPMLGGIGASVGNLIAVESKDKSYSIFKVIYLINFWIYSLSVIFLYNLLESFINWWLGEGYLLNSVTFIIILINFYLMGMRSSIFIFKNKGGIFVQDKYIPLIAAGINLVTSIILVRYIGITGIFIGTTISILSVIWNAPYLVYKHIFDIPVWSYYKKFILFLILSICVCMVTTSICSIVNFLSGGHSFLSLVVKGIICLTIPSLIYFAIFCKSQELQYILGILLPRIKGTIAALRKKTA